MPTKRAPSRARRRQFRLGLARPMGCAAARPAPPRERQFGQRLERGLGRAEAVDQIAEGRRADIVGVRIRRSQASRCRSLSATAAAGSAHPFAPIRAFGAGEQPRDVGAVLDEDDARSGRANSDREVAACPMKHSATGTTSGGDQRGQRGVARAASATSEPDGGEDQRRRPGQRRAARRDRWRRPCRP